MAKNIGNLQDKNGNTLFPSVIEVINQNDGIVFKYSDGTMLQTKYGTLNIPANGFLQWGNDLAVAEMDLGDWIVPFISEQLLYVIGESHFVITGASQLNQFWPCCGGIINKTKAGSFRLVRPNDAGTTLSWSVRVFRTAIGRWK